MVVILAQVTKEQIQMARKADLFSFLYANYSNQFKLESGSLHPVDNHSLSIKRGYSGYKDFATDETGNSIEFLERYLGYSFTDAVIALCGGENVAQIAQNSPKIENRVNVPPTFPKALDGRYKHLFAYLTNRGISADTIQMLIDKELLYQDAEHNNIVFINQEKDWGELRGTYTNAEKQFRGMVSNCRYDGFWWFQVGNDKADQVYICEAAIDAISLYELHRLDGTLGNSVYVSIGGVGKQATIDRLKKAKKVIIAVDNDDAGKECRIRNQECESIIPKNKDWNDDLKEKRG